ARSKVVLAIGKALRDRIEVKTLGPKLFEQAPNRFSKAAQIHHQRKELGLPSLRLEWDAGQCAEAGLWLLDCALGTNLFIRYEYKLGGKTHWFPQYCSHLEDLIDILREELIWRDPVYLPSLEPPRAQTDWEIRNYPFRTPFVRDSHLDTVKAVKESFALKRIPPDLFRHVDAFN